MRLVYRYSVVSFCPDLTKEDAASIPLAVLLVGKSETTGVAVIAAAPTTPPDLDPISQAIIKDLVGVIKQHVDDTFSRERSKIAENPTDTIHFFERSLRNSIHVSFVSEEQTLEAGKDAEDMVLHAVKEAMSALRRAVNQLRREGGAPYHLRDDDLFDIRSWPLPWLHQPESSRPSSRH